MIVSFKHKGLRRLFEDDDRRGVNAEHVEKIRLILFSLDSADEIDAIDLPSFRLHPLTGNMTGFWSVTVRANWRIIFRFADGHVFDVELIDYH